MVKIPHQIRALPSATGTDANAIQVTRSGVAAALVSIPQRYMHSPVEVCHLGDIEATVKLIAATILQLGRDTSFVPD